MKHADSDLDMELLHPSILSKIKSKSVQIVGTENVQDHTVYKIQVEVGECTWSLKKRFREFCSLHEELVVNYGLPWDLLPPKRFIGNMNKDHIEKRRGALEEYLQTIIAVLMNPPNEIIEFLEFDRFDVNSVCHKLAADLFVIGDSILNSNEVFTISPLQIHCINRRLLLPLPTCESSDPSEDIGHLYSFVSQAKHIKVQGGHDDLFITDQELTYDLSIFKSLQTLELSNCDLEFLKGMELLQNQLWELRVTGCIKFLKDVLITSETWNQGVLFEVGQGKQRHMARFPVWDSVVHAAFTSNRLSSIDNTITLLPNIRKLDLSHNFLSDVQFLEEFLYLRELDLSHNKLTDVEDFPYKLGNICILNLAGNHLRDVKGLDKMYSLRRLRLSDNSIEQLSNVLSLGNLPMLENVDLHGNPCANEPFYNIRVIAQFGDRYQDVTVDGVPTIKSDLAKALEIIKLQNSYEVISGPENYYRPGISASSKDSEPVKQLTAPRSPKARTPRKQHVADIKPAPVKNNRQVGLSEMEKEDEKFRDRIEKLREQAGHSWLTFYNEMGLEETSDNETRKLVSLKSSKEKLKFSEPQSSRAEASQGESTTQGGEQKHSKPVNKVRPMHLTKDPVHPQDVIKQMIRNRINAVVTDDKYEEQIPGSVFNILEDMLDQDIDLVNETFLVIREDETSGLTTECIISFDRDSDMLLEIDLGTGKTIRQFNFAKIRNIRVRKEAGSFWIAFDEESQDEMGSVLLEVKLRFLIAKDCAGLYALLVTFTEENTSNMLEKGTSPSPSEYKMERALPMDNPFYLKNEILLGFLQEFVQKTSTYKRDSEGRQRTNTGDDSQSFTYQNVGISIPFLKHAVNDNQQQDVIVTIWAGCLPYLFPEEELPTCLVMTNLNIFLFRVFLPDDASPSSLPKTVKEMKDLFHCFYSFALKSIKEIVVGLYDQAFRIEVKEEGPRGTFTFLTRHASKTAEFLEAYCSVVAFGGDAQNSLQDITRRMSFVSLDQNSSILYPDESKINALKNQLSAQDLCPLDDRENLISYCIVYTADANEDTDDLLYSSDTPVSTIKSLILTNLRLFMCDEDYVHWPAPSFVRSLPRTPEWIVDEEQPVSDLIGVDLWEDTEYKHTLVGNYGMTLTFDDSVAELTESASCEPCTKSWKVMFGSLSERDQFVRSLSCLWKNQFEQNLTVTYSKVTKLKPHVSCDTESQTSIPAAVAANFRPGHSRGASGNITSPWNAQIDSPEMIASLNPVRQKTYFIDNLALTEDEGSKGPYCVIHSGCLSYLDPDNEIPLTTVLGCSRIYLVVGEKNRALVNARKAIVNGSEGNPLWVAVIELSELRQVVVGLFDQFVRLEGDRPETTFTLVMRCHEKTNQFLQCLGQVLLLGQHDNNPSSARKDTTHNPIYKFYKDEDAKDDENGAPKTEFILPNSNVNIVYPSDESLDKLKNSILEFLMTTHECEPTEDFSILLYLLISAETEDGVQPCTLVISESFICLLKEDYINYPLPLFTKELPETPQYRPADARLIAAIVRIEFQDLSAGSFSIVFNRAVVEPSHYDQRFRTAEVEADVCLVTDMNTDRKVQEEQGALLWKLRAQSFAEREKIFTIVSKMWTNSYSGKTLPIVKRRHTKLSES
eukprot:gene6213-6929_t